MVEIDMIVGFVLIIAILSFTIFYSTNSFSTEFNSLRSDNVKEASLALQTQLFSTNDTSLIDYINKIQVIFRETTGTTHTEQVDIAVNPSIPNFKVYSENFTSISATTSTKKGKFTISFTLSFQPYELKKINIFYYGSPTNSLSYTSTGNGISASILSEMKVQIVSLAKCTSFTSLNYNDTKKLLGFNKDFRIETSNCVYGSNPPQADVVVSLYPTLVEKNDGSIVEEIVKLMVW